MGLAAQKFCPEDAGQIQGGSDPEISAVCKYYSVTQKQLVAVRRGVVNEPRDMAIYLLRTVCGEPLMTIGTKFGMNRYSSVSSAVDRIKVRQLKGNKVRSKLDNILAMVQKGQTET